MPKKKQNWCRGPDLYIAVPGRNSKSTSRHDRNKYSRQVLTVIAPSLSTSRRCADCQTGRIAALAEFA